MDWRKYKSYSGGDLLDKVRSQDPGEEFIDDDEWRILLYLQYLNEKLCYLWCGLFI